MTWGLRILDKGKMGLEVQHKPWDYNFCCISLYAHTTLLSEQIEEWCVCIKIDATRQ